jgi:hypothetical protein
MYDPIWFQPGASVTRLLPPIHLICQFVSPVGFLLLAAAYVRYRRHNYQHSNIYNLIPKNGNILKLAWLFLQVRLL